MNPKIALYGGAFDPPQLAHEEIARQAIEKLGLDRLYIVPSGPRPDKAYKAAFEYRKKIMQIFVTSINSPKAELSDVFLDGKIENTTLNTDRYFKNLLGFSPFQIFGSDLIPYFNKWDPTGEVSFRLPKIIIKRPGYPIDESLLGNYVELELNLMQDVSMLSSTQVRDGLKNGDFAGLNPELKEFIKDNSLYL